MGLLVFFSVISEKDPRSIQNNFEGVTQRGLRKIIHIIRSLEMGLRTSEMIGLTWSCVSFEKREITIEKTLEYRYSVGQWVWGPPKTKHGNRTLKLTNKAYEILKEIYDTREDKCQTCDGKA